LTLSVSVPLSSSIVRQTTTMTKIAALPV